MMTRTSSAATPTVPSKIFVASLMPGRSAGGGLSASVRVGTHRAKIKDTGLRRPGIERRCVASGTEWEQRVDYSRAVRVGKRVLVSGTTATDDDGEVVGGSAAEQARRAFENVERALDEAGASLADVVRARIHVTDVEDWEVVGAVHGEFFGEAQPVATLVL
jgi:enamine deaminase RidA (YjgF/YER057c/UK114 family)